jgi:hypothetical protein
MTSENIFDSCNDTELYQLCRTQGIPVLPSTTREELIGFLWGSIAPLPITEEMHPIDSWRHGLMGYILDHWKKLEAQLECPARSGDPRQCFGCLDTQVVTCLVENRGSERSLKMYRKGAR